MPKRRRSSKGGTTAGNSPVDTSIHSSVVARRRREAAQKRLAKLQRDREAAERALQEHQQRNQLTAPRDLHEIDMNIPLQQAQNIPLDTGAVEERRLRHELELIRADEHAQQNLTLDLVGEEEQVDRLMIQIDEEEALKEIERQRGQAERQLIFNRMLNDRPLINSLRPHEERHRQLEQAIDSISDSEATPGVKTMAKGIVNVLGRAIDLGVAYNQEVERRPTDEDADFDHSEADLPGDVGAGSRMEALRMIFETPRVQFDERGQSGSGEASLPNEEPIQRIYNGLRMLSEELPRLSNERGTTGSVEGGQIREIERNIDSSLRMIFETLPQTTDEQMDVRMDEAAIPPERKRTIDQAIRILIDRPIPRPLGELGSDPDIEQRNPTRPTIFSELERLYEQELPRRPTEDVPPEDPRLTVQTGGRRGVSAQLQRSGRIEPSRRPTEDVPPEDPRLTVQTGGRRARSGQIQYQSSGGDIPGRTIQSGGSSSIDRSQINVKAEAPGAPGAPGVQPSLTTDRGKMLPIRRNFMRRSATTAWGNSSDSDSDSSVSRNPPPPINPVRRPDEDARPSWLPRPRSQPEPLAPRTGRRTDRSLPELPTVPFFNPEGSVEIQLRRGQPLLFEDFRMEPNMGRFEGRQDTTALSTSRQRDIINKHLAPFLSKNYQNIKSVDIVGYLNAGDDNIPDGKAAIGIAQERAQYVKTQLLPTLEANARGWAQNGIRTKAGGWIAPDRRVYDIATGEVKTIEQSVDRDRTETVYFTVRDPYNSYIGIEVEVIVDGTTAPATEKQRWR
ncbi:hypothetical protein [Phaeodactylibacter xiamenensis]|uniref:hypothetical protein n=1 Tax=Phaeodactylibacter xiamenensis TaxID=1524460 RepID=UPI0024A8BC6E|nr:hypothetical protein [Phaeodactylibacter xiamenensis]